jgi:hypothetical protein
MTSHLRPLLLGLGVLAGASAIARAQEAPPPPRTAEALRVFLDCRTTYCDFDYVRTEINFVNYVRDPVDAQIFVLVTTEYTGGGGTQFTVNLLGQRDFTGRNDTLFYVSRQTDTYDEVRRGLTQFLKLGLVRYAARSVLAERIQITYEAPPGQPDGDRQRRDPWDYWVFNTGMSGNFSGEQSRLTTSLYGSLSANRTTERWKLSFGASAQYSHTVQNIAPDTSVGTDTHSESFGSLVVRSLGEHWAAACCRPSSTTSSRTPRPPATRSPSSTPSEWMRCATGRRRSTTGRGRFCRSTPCAPCTTPASRGAPRTRRCRARSTCTTRAR